MAKYDVYPSSDANGYLLDVQTDFMDHYDTRVVVPLMSIGMSPDAANTLNPVFTIGPDQYVMTTQYMSSVPTSILQSPVTNLSRHFAEITNALDFLFQGY